MIYLAIIFIIHLNPFGIACHKIPLSEVDIKLILSLHSNARESVIPPAAQMLKLEYNETLAKFAQNWSDRCIFEHPDPDEFPDYYPQGQNIAYISGKYNITKLLNMWLNEKKDYTYDTKMCQANKMCGHWTQMIWDITSELGCAITNCRVGTIHKKVAVNFLVCQYFPGGNYIDEYPYKAGESCSLCSANTTCQNNQCAQPEVKNRYYSNNTQEYKPGSSTLTIWHICLIVI